MLKKQVNASTGARGDCVAAATNNAKLTDNSSVIDCKLSNPKEQSPLRPTPSHLFHFNPSPLSITSLTPTLSFLPLSFLVILSFGPSRCLKHSP